MRSIALRLVVGVIKLPIGSGRHELRSAAKGA